LHDYIRPGVIEGWESWQVIYRTYRYAGADAMETEETHVQSSLAVITRER
jgi:hypothetical protein